MVCGKYHLPGSVTNKRVITGRQKNEMTDVPHGYQVVKII